MSFDGRAIANFILDFCDGRDRAVSNLSLQKIIYFCHVWSLIDLDKPLVRHEFEAWQYGPVLQYLYRDFKAFDDKPVVIRATSLDPSTGKKAVVKYEFDANTDDLLHRVVDFYSRLRASDLVQLSHVRGGPWYQVWNHEGTSNPGMKIKNEQILEFYSRVKSPFSIQ